MNKIYVICIINKCRVNVFFYQIYVCVLRLKRFAYLSKKRYQLLKSCLLLEMLGQIACKNHMIVKRSLQNFFNARFMQNWQTLAINWMA